MKRLICLATTIGAVALLVGCAQPAGVSGAIPQRVARAQTSSSSYGDLLYVSANGGAVSYYTYPAGELVGTLNAGGTGLCSDTKGNVYVVNRYAITEFAHGGTSPINAFSGYGFNYNSCSVDPNSCVLAVAFLGLHSGYPPGIAIFKHGSGRQYTYPDADFENLDYCGYDGSGNLIADGYISGEGVELAELPAGSRKLKTVRLFVALTQPGQVQWDGTYTTVADAKGARIFRLRIKGSLATSAGSTRLHGFANAFFASWIYDGAVILPFAKRGVGYVGFWNYPQGGSPTKIFPGPGYHTTDNAVTISALPAPGSHANAAQRASASEMVLHSFSGGPSDGEYPFAGLLNVNGTLYGTTRFGGAKGAGTVFAIKPSGKETILHSFAGRSKDGSEPFAGLVNVDGTLYGTTYYGGTNNYGVVYAIKPSGEERVLHSFYGSNGAEPAAGLLNVNGTLYGTTSFGGAIGYGTVFSITTSGKLTVLYSFGQGSTDGGKPYAGLVDLNGTLYGTTAIGGDHSYGTVFTVTTSGTETVLHSFDGYDGDYPQAGLVNVNGTLYGTTEAGGAKNAGAVFAITTSGDETLIHSFGETQDDGAAPYAGLLNLKGTLYGTTNAGGSGRSDGTVFAVTSSGTETVLHSFGLHGRDGTNPYAALANVNGTLYGTTYKGGAGYGTVFSVTP